MPRYEFSEGTSNKFWDITLSGDSFTTTYGKIGTSGQSTTKSFATEAKAKAAYDKAIESKTKKGYALVDGGKSTAKPAASTAKPASKQADASAGGTIDARNPALEAAIVADPFDREAYEVFADWLQTQGDLRGQLISLQLGNKDKQAKALIDKHADYFLGPLAEHVEVRDMGYNNSVSHLRTPAQEKEWQKTHRQAFLWRNGYIHRVRLSHDSYSDSEWKGKTVDVLDAVLSHPSGRYVVEFAFQSNGDPNEDDLQNIIDLLGKKAPPTTRKITFGDNVDQISWHHTGGLGKLWKGVPNLRVLEIETGEFDVGKMIAPALERAVFITGGMSKTCAKNIATADMPNIKHLEIYYGDPNYGGNATIKEVRPLLERTDLTQLEYLGLENSMFADDIARHLGKAPVLRSLKTLDLSQGTMTDAGAQALVAARDSLRHLECLDLTRNFLSKEGIKAVKDLCPKVLTGGQETPDEGDDEPYYYVSIAE
jgi:uncharacterized protein (TIGR02996 family)